MRLFLVLFASVNILAACAAETEPGGADASVTTATEADEVQMGSDSAENSLNDESYRCTNNGESSFMLYVYELKVRETPTGRTVVEGMYRTEGDNYMLEEKGYVSTDGPNYLIGDFEFEGDDDGSITWVSEGSGDFITCERA